MHVDHHIDAMGICGGHSGANPGQVTQIDLIANRFPGRPICDEADHVHSLSRSIGPVSLVEGSYGRQAGISREIVAQVVEIGTSKKYLSACAVVDTGLLASHRLEPQKFA